MNPDKNREAEDKIDQTLFCCFDGSLSIYFKNNDDWFLYFNNLNKIIFYRNNQHFSSHLPFEW